jgi:hypothetical protein
MYKAAQQSDNRDRFTYSVWSAPISVTACTNCYNFLLTDVWAKCTVNHLDKMVALEVYIKCLFDKSDFGCFISSLKWSWNRTQKRTELSFRLQKVKNLRNVRNSLEFLDHETKRIYVSWRLNIYLHIYDKKK